MYVNVPANIPYDEIFDLWKEKRIDKRINLENTVYIILDYMICGKGLNAIFIEPISLSSKLFKKICSENFFIVKNELEKRGIIRQNLDLGKYEVGITSERYNLPLNYCFAGTIQVEIKEGSTLRNYEFFKENGFLHKVNLNEGKDIKHIFDQFDNLDIEILPEIHLFKQLYQERLQYHLFENWNRKKIRYLILAKMGQMEQNVVNIFERRFDPKLNLQNLRFHSLFTNVIKELRAFIRINGNELIEFDLKSSNLYVLATLMNFDFFNESKGKYNLNKIFKKLHKKIENIKEAKKKEPTTEGRQGARERKVPYLCPTFFEREDVVLFRQLSFESGFYEQLIEITRLNHSDLLMKHPKLGDRDSVKNMVLSFLTDIEKKHRKNMVIVKLMERVFPSISEFVSSNLVYRNFKSPMPYLLQRAESFLILDIVAKELINTFPGSKLITIHDCFLMEDIGLDRNEVVTKIKQTLFEFTGITPGVTVKTSNPMLEVDDIVDKTVKKQISKSFVQEDLSTPIEKRLFSPVIINQVVSGIILMYDGIERTKKLEEFKLFVDKRHGH